MKVSVIYVNFNTKDLIIDSIRSVFEKTKGVDFEIIVVDNQSSDNSLEVLKSEFGDRIKLIDAGENLGFGRANNLGSQSATGEYLYFLNPDTLLMNDAIFELTNFLDHNEKVAAACSNLYFPNGEPQFCVSVKPIRLNEVYNELKGKYL